MTWGYDDDDWDWVPMPGSPREILFDPEKLSWLRMRARQVDAERGGAGDVDATTSEVARSLANGCCVGSRQESSVEWQKEASQPVVAASSGNNRREDVESRRKTPKGESGACNRAKLKKSRGSEDDSGPSKPVRGERRPLVFHRWSLKLKN